MYSFGAMFVLWRTINNEVLYFNVLELYYFNTVNAIGNNKLHFITFIIQSLFMFCIYVSKCIMREHDSEQMYK